MSKLPSKGVKRPDPAKLAERLARGLHPAHHARLSAHLTNSAPLPDAVDNSKMPPTDQGPTSSCTAHSLVKGVEILTGFVGSMHCLYSMTGTQEGESPLADDGRQCIDCLTVVSTQGLHSFEGDVEGRNSDVGAANVCVPATAEETSALTKFALGDNSIDPAASNLPDLLASCLAAKGVVYLGTQVGQAFESLSGDQVAEPDTIPNDPNGGGHALIVVGYRTINGVRQFKVQNSWGSWDNSGCCWVSVAWCAACWELHPLLPVCP